MRKIRVAQVITRLDWGGSPDIVRLISGSLNPEIFEVTLISGKTKYPSLKTKEFLKGFKGNIQIIPELQRGINPINDLIASAKLYLLFIRERFDIVHTHTAKAGVLGRISARCARLSGGRPVIIHTPHGHNFYGYFPRAASLMIIVIERVLAWFTDTIIALTELEKKDFIQFKVANAQKLEVIGQGLDLDEILYQQPHDKASAKAKFGIKSDEDVVGMVGRLEPVKGPGYFVQAALDLAARFPKVKFILVGQGSLKNKLEKTVSDSGFKERFIFTGWRDDIPEVFSMLDLLVLPSLNEAVGMVLIEAQASGVPVVATKVGGVAEIVKDKETGILVPARDSAELASAINYLLTQKQDRLGMSRAAKDWVRGKFDAGVMVDKIEKLYLGALKGRKGLDF